MYVCHCCSFLVPRLPSHVYIYIHRKHYMYSLYRKHSSPPIFFVILQLVHVGFSSSPYREQNQSQLHSTPKIPTPIIFIHPYVLHQIKYNLFFSGYRPRIRSHQALPYRYPTDRAPQVEAVHPHSASHLPSTTQLLQSTNRAPKN